MEVILIPNDGFACKVGAVGEVLYQVPQTFLIIPGVAQAPHASAYGHPE